MASFCADVPLRTYSLPPACSKGCKPSLCWNGGITFLSGLSWGVFSPSCAK